MSNVNDKNWINWNTATYWEKQRAINRDRRRRWSAWQNEDRREVELCKGVSIDETVYDISENRYYTLILKGIIVYMITVGGIGCYLTALDVEFNQIIFNIIILITAVICAVLYHSWRSENLGYLGFFAVYASAMILFRDYINSGFYAVLNDTIDRASIYFDTEGLQYYNERISNRYVAVTVAACILGIAMNVLLNNYILRNARYLVAIFLSISINVICFYMQNEPDTIYSILVLTGLFMTFILKGGRHFKLSRRDHVFERKKTGLSYALDYRTLWQGMVVAFAVVLAVVGIMSTVYNKTTYDYEQLPSDKKSVTREVFQNFIMLGFFGIIDYYPSNGGLATGELGGVSSIRLDYQTDITVLYTPYSMDMLYIRNFTGGWYMPYENKWESLIVHGNSDNPNVDIYTPNYSNEVKALSDAYKEKDEYSARAYVTITNVEAPALPYQPYYSDGERKPVFGRQSTTYTVYPRFAESTVKVPETDINPAYLDVPEINKEVIDAFIEEAGFTDGTPMEIAQQIKDYYQENIPYTIRPGATPWREDFVNYFLTDNRKGYCAHFASAATLIFREMGVPARYCEGYAISFTQMATNGEIVEGEEYSNHYDGYNPLGETALVRVDATDADAHAWVEIYDGDRGWVVVEVTPSSGLEEEEEEESFWDNFNNLFGDGSEDLAERDSDDDGGGLSISGADRVMGIVAYVVIGILILGILGYILIKLLPEIRYHIAYKKAGPSDKLILKYSRCVKKKKRKDREFRKMMNYTDQMGYLLSTQVKDMERMIDILERAGFSNHEISDEEYTFADGKVDSVFKKK